MTMLLSRVAERVYWQARYLERVENSARLMGVLSNLLFDLPQGTKLGWRTLVEITGTDAAFDQRYKQDSERNVMRFLLVEDNGLSVSSMLQAARENARTTREIMPAEAFELINNLYYYARNNLQQGVNRGSRHQMMEELIGICQQLWGLLAGSMSRDATYAFIRLGRSLERADMTTRIVDTGSCNLLPSLSGKTAETTATEPYENILWMSILRSQSAYQMYRQHVRHRVNPADVVRFLLQNEEFPRAVAHNLTTLVKVLQNLPNNARVLRQVNKTRRIVGHEDMDTLSQTGLLQYIDDLQVEMGVIHDFIATTWFLPGK